MAPLFARVTKAEKALPPQFAQIPCLRRALLESDDCAQDSKGHPLTRIGSKAAAGSSCSFAKAENRLCRNGQSVEVRNG